MAETQWLRTHELRKPEDLDRLHPHDMAQLTLPATRFDLMRLQLDVVHRFQELLDILKEAGVLR